jgi:hypothetical protein
LDTLNLGGDSDVGDDYGRVEAKVLMRTAYLTWEKDIKKDEAEGILANLKRHALLVLGVVSFTDMLVAR